jgi:dihydroxyacetone kinase
MQRSLQPRQVARHVDNLAASDLADLVNAIGKLIATVFDIDAGVPHVAVLAVHIGNAGHEINLLPAP